MQVRKLIPVGWAGLYLHPGVQTIPSRKGTAEASFPRLVRLPEALRKLVWDAGCRVGCGVQGGMQGAVCGVQDVE